MTTINQLPAVDSLSGGDLLPVFNTANGDTRKASLTAVKEFVQDGFVPDGGVLAISGYYSMRKVPATPLTIAVGTSYANFANYDSPAMTFPAGRTSIAGMITVGEFVMQRDVAAVEFWAAMTGTWPTNRDLTLAILVGTDAAPYESASKFIGAGRGATNLVSAMFGSPVVNLNNPGGTIKAGEKVRLVAKMNIADNMDLTRLTFVVKTLDGL
jgi:hypothetical protein